MVALNTQAYWMSLDASLEYVLSLPEPSIDVTEK
jgi:hypothetical protein